MQNILALFSEDPNEQEAKIRQEQIDIKHQAKKADLRIKGVQTTLAKELAIKNRVDAEAAISTAKRKQNERTSLSTEWAAKIGAKSVTAEGGRSGRKARGQNLGPLAVIAKAQSAERGLNHNISAARNKADQNFANAQLKANEIQGLGVAGVPGHTYKVKTAAEKWTMAGLDAVKIAASAGAFGTFADVPGVAKDQIGKQGDIWSLLFRRNQLKGGLSGN